MTSETGNTWLFNFRIRLTSRFRISTCLRFHQFYFSDREKRKEIFNEVRQVLRGERRRSRKRESSLNMPDVNESF